MLTVDLQYLRLYFCTLDKSNHMYWNWHCWSLGIWSRSFNGAKGIQFQGLLHQEALYISLWSFHCDQWSNKRQLEASVRGVTAPINEVLEGLADLLEISPKLLEVGRFSKFVGNWMMEWFFVGFWIFISWILVYSWILDLKMQENALFLPKFQKFSQAGRSPEPSKFFTSSTRRNRACSTYLLLYGYHIQPFKSF